MKKRIKCPQDWETRISSLKHIMEIQCSDGNWDFDDYMYGLANGLIIAYNIMEESSKRNDVPTLTKQKKNRKKKNK